MQQGDLFDETLQKKIFRMEKWLLRLQRELWFLKEVNNLSKKSHKIDTLKKHIQQIDMFGT